MPISSRACPVGEPAVTSLRPSKLAIKVAGAAVVLPGTVIPSGVVLAEAAVTPRVPSAAAAARPAPIARARRRLVVLIMMIVLPDFGRRSAPVGGLIVPRAGPAVRPGELRFLGPGSAGTDELVGGADVVVREIAAHHRRHSRRCYLVATRWPGDGAWFVVLGARRPGADVKKVQLAKASTVIASISSDRVT